MTIWSLTNLYFAIGLMPLRGVFFPVVKPV